LETAPVEVKIFPKEVAVCVPEPAVVVLIAVPPGALVAIWKEFAPNPVAMM
jgi:hypothetical protein